MCVAGCSQDIYHQTQAWSETKAKPTYTAVGTDEDWKQNTVYSFCAYIGCHTVSCVLWQWLHLSTCIPITASFRLILRDLVWWYYYTITIFYSHFPPIDTIRALMIVWRLIEKIIRTGRCCIVWLLSNYWE